MKIASRSLAGLITLSLGALALAQTVSLTPIPSGAMRKIGFYYPQRIEVTDTKPAGLLKEPAGLKSPSYGVIKLQGKSFYFVVDRPDTGEGKLYVDTAGTGDLSQATPSEWNSKEYKYPDGSTFHQHMGSAKVSIKLAGKDTEVSLGAYMFDKNDQKRAQLKNAFLYYSDYACEGKVKLGSETYNFILADLMATGDFRGAADTGRGSGVDILIDRQNNGKYNQKGEIYDAKKPFNIGGTTYELADLTADGGKLRVAKSIQTVAEVALPPNLAVHSKALAFKATTLSGKAVDFPTTFKGKIVMLDFWATWCGPCMGEVPNVVANYNKFHDQGFEILGISLDNKDTAKNIASVTKDKGMTWEQVSDQNYWQAAVAQLYNIESIPAAFLIDGDTGEILAEGEDIRGEGLAKALQTALTTKKKGAKK